MSNRLHKGVAVLFFVCLAVISGMMGCNQGSSSSGTFIDKATGITTAGATGSVSGVGAPTLLAGRIVDAVTNLGVNNVTIKTEGNQTATTKNNGTRDGIFVIQSVPTGTYYIFASKSNYETAQKEVTLNATHAGKTVDIGDIVVYPLGSPNAGTIKGQVTDKADGQGENGVKIQIESGISVLTANDGVRDGTYVINNAPVGTYTIKATKSGFSEVSASIEMTRLQTVTNDMEIIASGSDPNPGSGNQDYTSRTIRGQVTDSVSGLGLDGCQVRTEGGLVSTTTNDGVNSGVFVISNAPASEEGLPYFLFISKAGYIENKFQIKVIAGATVSGYQNISNLVLEAIAKETGTLYGQVKDSANSQGLNDVTVTLEGGLSVITANNGIVNGAFKFDKTAPVGTYSVTFSRAGYLTATTPNAISVAPDELKELPFILNRSQSDPDKATITGNVDDISVENSTTAPKSRVYIYTRDSNGDVVKIDGETVDTYSVYLGDNSDLDGSFTLMNVPPGNYTIVGELENYQEGTVDNIITTAGGVVENINIQIKGILGSIAGVVYQDINDDKIFTRGIDFPIAGATIEIDSTNFVTFSKINGVYKIDNVNIANDYILVAGASVEGRGRYLENYVDGVNVTPDAAEVTDVNIWLSPASSLAGIGHVDGYVKDTYGNPLDSATVEIDPGGANNKTVFTQSDGFFFIRDINAGTYILKARKLYYSSKTQIVSINADNTSTHVQDERTEGFYLQPNKASISGFVYNDIDGNGIYDVNIDDVIDLAELEVDFVGPDLPAGETGKSNTESANNGLFTLYGIPFGERIIKVSHDSFSSSQLAITVDEAIETNQNIGMLSKIGFVTGEVILDLNGDNIKDPGETNLGNVTVQLLGESTETFVTGNDGIFVFRNFKIGGYTLNASKASYGSNSRYIDIIPNKSNPASPVIIGLNQKLASISGRVIEVLTFEDTDGPAVAGATVEIQGSANAAHKTKSVAGSGQFLIGSLLAELDGTGAASTDYTLQAFSDLYEANSEKVENIGPGENRTGVLVKLKKKTGTIVGVISEAGSGAGINDAIVYLSNTSMTYTTDADGSYRFDGVPIGEDYRIEVVATGYEQGSPLSITVTPNQQSTGGLSLTKGTGSIVGMVRDDTTQGALEGISVELMGSGYGTQSLANGSYSISNVAQGKHNIVAYSAFYEANLQSITVTSGAVLSDVNFNLNNLTGTLQGRVISDASIPTPVEGVLIRIENTDHVTTNTTIDGTFSIANVPIGSNFLVKAFKSKYVTGSRTVEIKANNTSTLDFTLTKARGALTGLVIEKDSQLPLNGISVEIPGTLHKTVTASGGIYLISNLEAGSYTIAVSASNHESATKTGITVVEDATTNVEKIELTVKTGSVAGIVRDSKTGNPMEGVTVVGQGMSTNTATGANGSYLIESIPITLSPVMVEASVSDYQNVTGEAAIQPGSTVSLDFYITKNIGYIAGQVTDSSNGSGVSNATIRLRGTLLSTNSDADGLFDIADIPISVNNAVIEASKPGYSNGSLSNVAINAGETTVANVQMQPNFASIAGRVVDSTTKLGISAVSVRIVDANITTPTDADGLYLYKDIPLGVSGTTVQAFKAGYGQAEQTGVTFEMGKTSDINFFLTSLTGSIVGTVSDSRTGIGLSGSMIRVKGSSQFATTDNNGAYTIENVKVQTGLVSVATASGYTSVDSVSTEIKPSVASIIDFVLTITTGSLAGQVYDVTTGDGIPNAFVRLSGTVHSTTTNVYGIYELIEIASVSGATAEFQANGYKSTRVSGINVAPGSTASVNIGMTSTSGAITGFVRDGSNGAGIADAIVSVSGSTLLATTSTTGAYSFTKVPADELMDVSVQYSGFLEAKTLGVSVEPGRAITVNFDLVPQTGSIAGKITDSATHKSLPNVTITLSGYQVRASSDTSGNYFINNLAEASDLTLIATLENYKVVNITGLDVSGGDMLTNNFNMTPNYGTISGIIKSSSTQLGVLNAIVQIPGSGLMPSSTNSGGYYEVAGLPENIITGYDIKVSKDGYNNASSHIDSVTGGANLQITDIVITPTTGTITGTITDASTGLGIAGVTLNIPDAGKSDFTTNTGGFYMIDNVASSTENYIMHAFKTGFDSYSITLSKTLTGGETISENFSLTPSTGSITGTVTDSRTGLGLQSVSLVIPGSGLSPVQTNSSGYFEILQVPSSEDNATEGPSIKASLVGYVNQTLTSGTIEGGGFRNLDFILTKSTGTIAGTVTNSANDIPVTGVYVYIPGANINDTTTSGGGFELANVPSTTNSINIKASIDGYRMGNGTVEGLAGGETKIIGITIEKSLGTISGTVKDSSNLGLSNALLTVSGLVPTRSGEGGLYTISDVPVNTGTVKVDITLSGFHTTSVQIGPIAGDKTTPYDISLYPNVGILAGTVSDSESKLGLSEVTINILGGSGKTDQTDISGYFEIPGVPETTGEVSLSATLAGYQGKKFKITGVAAGTVNDVDLELERLTGTITGTVLDSITKSSLPNISITIPGTTHSTNTTAAGTFTIADVNVSTLGVNVQASGTNYISGQKTSDPLVGGSIETVMIELTPSIGTVTGQVVDAFTNLGVSNVSVVRPGSSSASNSTDGSGTFTVQIETGVGGVSVELVFSKNNYFSENLTTFTLGNDKASIYGGKITDVAEITLTPTIGTITGRVVDGASFKGLEYAIVRIQGNNELSAISGVGGTYIITGVPVLNNYTIEASIAEYSSSSGTTELLAGTSSLVDIFLTPQTGTISGIVRNYADNLGIQSASVRVQGDNNTIQQTQAGGYYELTNVAADPTGVPVTVTMTNYGPMTLTSVAVQGGSSITLDFDLTPTTGTIIGTVIDKFSRLGLSGVLVKAPGLGVSQIYTSASGSYQLTNVPADPDKGISIEVSKIGYQTVTELTDALTGGVVVTKNYEITQVVGSIVGTVLDNDTNLGVSGSSVTISGSTLSPYVTGNSGYFFITNVPINDTGVILSVTADNYGTTTESTPAIVGGVQLDVGDIRIDSLYGTIAGSVKDGSNQIGIMNVLVRIPGTSRSTFTKDGGYYELTGVPETGPGLNLEAVVTGYEIKKEVIAETVESGIIVTQDILMTSLYGDIVGTIKDSKTLIGVSGIEVRVSGLSKLTTTDSAGYYELTDVPSNHAGVVLIASKKNYKIYQSTQIGVTGGEQSNGDFVVTPSVGVIAGTVINAKTGLALFDAKLRIKDTTISGSTDINGYYILSEIPEKDDQYVVECSYTNFKNQTADAPDGAGTTFEGGLSLTIDYSLEPSTGYLTGVVTDAVTGLGITGVELATNISTVAKFTTQAGGYYQFTNYPLDVGVQISVNALNYRYQGISKEITLTTTNSTEDFELTPAYGSIIGQVTDSKNFPKADAVIKILDYNLSATTDDNGAYIISDMPLKKDIGDISVNLAGYGSIIGTTLSATQLSVSTMSQNLDFVLSRLTGAVTGSCVDGSTGDIIPYCYVTLSNDEWFFSSTTGAEGTFEFTEVPAGENGAGFTIVGAKGTQYAMTSDAASRTFDIQEGVTHEMQLDLYSNFAAGLRVYGTIHIRDEAAGNDALPTTTSLVDEPAGILDADHKPENIIVRLAGSGYSTTTDSEGRFMLYLDDAIADEGLDNVITIALEAVVRNSANTAAGSYVTMEYYVVNTASFECFINDNGTNNPDGTAQPKGNIKHVGGIMIHEADVDPLQWP